ncbi:cell division protein ZapA [Grimontia hollisae]|uniref:Cell division protein ZapA n=2 Tax=Grimontia hollisae TaxID=673 RepID=D0I4K5_GRIHO|nr:cell division protein ZapA [Grimontia hollisae]AMG30131.1 cell division protein ZapA [Grimontia hollisae]EEY73422.1 Z-ring-associated protein ZapA [Grimontia hollisae CIP 101886]MDF2184528.1 cell division protein ZapA [Grimontia hollisae]STO42643.1 Z ring-associated protein ZapA [Grimontia hollisae]STO56508.1 Z ring-associated protein ZapA [Grimontia hollisae]
MTTQAVEIRILGKTMRVNCPTGQEQALTDAANDFDQRLHELSERTKVTNTEQLLTIAALNVCYELRAERQKSIDEQADMAQRISLLQQTIEEALLKHSASKEG